MTNAQLLYNRLQSIADTQLALGEPMRSITTRLFTPISAIRCLHVSLAETIMLAPNLTIKPLGQGLSLVAQSCGCGANVCHNTAGCPG